MDWEEVQTANMIAPPLKPLQNEVHELPQALSSVNEETQRHFPSNFIS